MSASITHKLLLLIALVQDELFQPHYQVSKDGNGNSIPDTKIYFPRDDSNVNDFDHYDDTRDNRDDDNDYITNDKEPELTFGLGSVATNDPRPFVLKQLPDIASPVVDRRPAVLKRSSESVISMRSGVSARFEEDFSGSGGQEEQKEVTSNGRGPNNVSVCLF